MGSLDATVMTCQQEFCVAYMLCTEHLYGFSCTSIMHGAICTDCLVNGFSLFLSQ
jgi:hypothetical protein